MTPGLSDILEAALAEGLADVNFGMPGEIVSYDSSTRSASVQPLVKRGRLVDGEREVERYPVINHVPVMFPGIGDYEIIMPVAAGDLVWLAFASCSLDKWLAIGGEVDPEDDRRGHISDAVAHVGMHTIGRPRAAVPTKQIRFTSSTIEIGGPVVVSTIKGPGYQSAMTTLLTAFSTYLTGIQGVADPSNVLTPVMLTAITAFVNAQAAQLTTITKVS